VTPGFVIAPARGAQDMAVVARLLEAYAASLPVDLGYQDFEGELAGLPGRYAPPRGEILLASSPDGAPLGCVALRPLEEERCCEMKRLYVVPDARDLGLGRALAGQIVREASRIGYREIRLDTLPSMASAIRLYRRMGFRPVAPYYFGAPEGSLFLALRLLRRSRRADTSRAGAQAYDPRPDD
jgi:ribosomal protein S18 acetylase RimI-like enzyme